MPASVLLDFSFAPKPVSCIAAEFLESIATRPLLCIGAVNPGLYARVPALTRAHELRVRTCKALAAARAKGSAQKVMSGFLPHLKESVTRVPLFPGQHRGCSVGKTEAQLLLFGSVSTCNIRRSGIEVWEIIILPLQSQVLCISPVLCTSWA